MDIQPQEWLHCHSVKHWFKIMSFLNSVEFRKCLQKVGSVYNEESVRGDELVKSAWKWHQGEDDL